MLLVGLGLRTRVGYADPFSIHLFVHIQQVVDTTYIHTSLLIAIWRILQQCVNCGKFGSPVLTEKHIASTECTIRSEVVNG